MKELKRIAMQDAANVKVHGRTTKERNPITLFWTASAIECNVKASELWIELSSTYDVYEPWISILVNGACVSRLMLTEGTHRICIFRNMNSEVAKNIRIVKDTQAMPSDTKHCLQLHAIETDGELLPVEERPYRLEFIGDSITSGEGTIGAVEEVDWVSMFMSSQNHYGTMTANKLNADYRVLSQGGWGTYASWDNNPNNVMPAYYEYICGVIQGENNLKLGVMEKNDFSEWIPDAVIINLGTNDNGAFHNQAYVDEVTGEVYKQRLNEDGTFNEEDLAKFKNAVYEFIKKVRFYNPNTQIVWTYGMIGHDMANSIAEMVDKYKKDTKDSKVSFLILPDMTPETVGARSHPGVKAHQIAADVLAAYLKDLLQ